MKKKVITLFASFFVLLIIYFLYPEKRLPATTKINKLVVFKSKRKLLAYSNKEIVKEYVISLGGNPKGHKQFEGDNKTPEGIYFISGKAPHHIFHKYLHVSYPNAADIRFAKKSGKSPGGQILIHGLNKKFSFLKKFHRWYDWTRGCIAVTDAEIDELYSAVEVGSKIEIYP